MNSNKQLADDLHVLNYKISSLNNVDLASGGACNKQNEVVTCDNNEDLGSFVCRTFLENSATKPTFSPTLSEQSLVKTSSRNQPTFIIAGIENTVEEKDQLSKPILESQTSCNDKLNLKLLSDAIDYAPLPFQQWAENCECDDVSASQFENMYNYVISLPTSYVARFDVVKDAHRICMYYNSSSQMVFFILLFLYFLPCFLKSLLYLFSFTL